MPFSPEDRLKAAKDQLSLVLGFFPRVDTKLSVVLGLDLAMLGTLATRHPALASARAPWWVATGAATLLLAASLWHLYHGSFPRLAGGTSSLTYFREIAGRTEVRYVDAFLQLDAEALARDVLGQVWRNAEILRLKFDHLVWAYRLMALATVPWLVSLAILSWR